MQMKHKKPKAKKYTLIPEQSCPDHKKVAGQTVDLND